MSKFFDTNVLVYLADTADARKTDVALRLVKAAITGPMECRIGTQTLSEFVNVCIGKLKMTREQVDGYLDFFSDIPVVKTDERIVRRGLEIRFTYKIQFYDAMMLAAAESSGCEEFYSEDLNDGQIYCGMTVVNPFKV